VVLVLRCRGRVCCCVALLLLRDLGSSDLCLQRLHCCRALRGRRRGRLQRLQVCARGLLLLLVAAC
jgi:hypothetical protein